MLIIYNIPEQGGWFVLEAGGISAIKLGGPFNTRQEALNYRNNTEISRKLSNLGKAPTK
jgi:hypothetical protein